MKLRPLLRRIWEAGEAAHRKHFNRSSFTGSVQPPLDLGQWLLAAFAAVLLGVLLARLLLAISLPPAVRAPLAARLPVRNRWQAAERLPPPFVPPATSNPTQRLAPGWPQAVTQWAPAIEQVALESGFNPNLLAAIVLRESNGQPQAASSAGAVGLMGIMAQGSGPGLESRPTAERLQQPLLNLRTGAAILAGYLHDADGDLRTALAIYNGGYLFADQPHVQAYAEQLLDDYSRAIAAQYGLPERNYQLIFADNQRARSLHPVYDGERDSSRLQLRAYLLPR